MQPKMFSSCDALPYHWKPISMAERVGLPPCNGSPTLNTLLHRFFVPPVSPRLQVLRRSGSGEATGGDAVDGSSLMLHLHLHLLSVLNHRVDYSDTGNEEGGGGGG